MLDPRAGVTGKRIILEIVREMREGLHPLLYSRVAPGLYCVYLHPEDFSRIEGLVPRVRGEAQRALAEEMRRLNAPSKPNALRWFVADDPAPPVEEPAGGWVIQIEADRDDEVAPGTFVILSKLSLPPLPQFEGGSPTTKVFKTVISGESRTKTSQVFATPPSPAIAAPAAAPTSVGATGVGATGIGATGVGGPGVGATGVGGSSGAATGVGTTGVAATGVGTTGVAATGIGTTGVGATGVGPTGVAATGVGATAGGTTGVDAPLVGAPTAAPFVVGAGAPAPGVAAPPPLRASVPVVRGLAEIAVQDAHGHRIFVMDKHDIKIGRGGQFRLVDLQLDGPTRISRVHARIRRDDQGRFFIKDLSEWGTTVNGQQIARGVIREGEEVREIDVEAELPSRARIGLADAVFLEFTAAPAPASATATATTTAATRIERVRDVPTPTESRPGTNVPLIDGARDLRERGERGEVLAPAAGATAQAGDVRERGEVGVPASGGAAPARTHADADAVVTMPADRAGASDELAGALDGGGVARIDDAVETHEAAAVAMYESADVARDVATAGIGRVGTGAVMMQEPMHAGPSPSAAIGESSAVRQAGVASSTGRVVGAGGGRA